MSNKMNITYLPFKLLRLAGQNVKGNYLIFTILDTIIVFSCFSLGSLEPILHFEGPDTLAGALEVASPAHQWLTKMLIYKFYKKTFQKLIKNMDKFWSLDSQGEEIESKLIQTFTYVQTGFKIFFGCSAVATTLMCLKPLLTSLALKSNSKQLPVVVYHFIDLTQSPFYQITYAIHCVHLYLILMFVVGFDGLFLTMCTSAMGQLFLLQNALINLKYDTNKNRKNCRKLIKKYVQHHDFILEFFKEIRNIFSFLLLNQFLSSTICVCMAIYLTLSKGLSDVVFMFRCGLFAVSGVLQIFIYCITGTFIKSHMEAVSYSIYECDWWKGNKDLQLATLLISQRAQITSNIKAGGMIDLDLQSFVSILRLSFSFYTIMQSTTETK